MFWNQINESNAWLLKITPNLSEAIKEKAVSNSAKGFNEVRSHIKSVCLVNVLQLANENKCNQDPSTSEISTMATDAYFITFKLFFKTISTWFEPTNPQVVALVTTSFQIKYLAVVNQTSLQTGLTSVNVSGQTVQRKWHGNSLSPAVCRPTTASHSPSSGSSARRSSRGSGDGSKPRCSVCW